MSRPDKPPILPALSDAFDNIRSDVFYSLNCVKIGKINSFDGTKKTASVQLLFKRLDHDGNILSYPILNDCPVLTLQGGGAAIEMPVTVGDHCLVLFCDRNIDNWYAYGAESLPPSGRAHDISDAIVLVGLNALTSTLGNYSANELTIKYGGAYLGEKAGLITIQNAAQSLLTIMTNLLTTLEGITDANNIPLSAASIAAIEAYKVQFSALLY